MNWERASLGRGGTWIGPGFIVCMYKILRNKEKWILQIAVWVANLFHEMIISIQFRVISEITLNILLPFLYSVFVQSGVLSTNVYKIRI